ncbi:hypothetical protein TrVE_jg664 [Triparma verrucosa]|uniref:GH16 domain-containing protein n=1 Tax=Triparma verrucosa TaxID=1606542 RepID=A0A9W7KY07_9STRA|nr:hypothetical protein TrVE_jg664 [Triparma verrucosa]
MKLIATLATLLLATSTALASFCDDDDFFVEEFVEDFTSFDETRFTKIVGENLGACRSATCLEENVYIEESALVLKSDRVEGGNFTSGAVWTKGKSNWTTADGTFRLCVRAMLPGDDNGADGVNQGIWPAHWLMPEDSSCDPDEGEPDILEMVNGDGIAHSTYHWMESYPNDNCTKDYDENHKSVSIGKPIKNWSTDYHEYAVERSKDYIAFIQDGNVILNASATTDDSPPLLWDMPFHLILNTAIGGEWPGEPTENTTFPVYHYIDYMKVSRKKE